MKSLTPVLFLLILVSCSGYEQETKTASSYSLSETEEIHPLRDDLRPMNHVSRILPVNDSDMIVVDNTPAFFLFRDHEMISTIGTAGNGPCEYQDYSALDLRGDSLFVFSPMQTKIITYNIRTGECLGETTHQDLSSHSYMQRGDRFFYTADVNYGYSTPDSTRLVFKLHDNETMEALDLSLGNVNPVKTMISWRMPLLNFSSTGNKLYTYFPLTDKLMVLNRDTELFISFPLQVDINRSGFEEAGDNLQSILQIQQNEMEMIGSVRATAEWIAVVMSKPDLENETTDPWLQFYSLEGAFLNEFPLEGQLVSVQNERMIFLREATDPSAGYAYELVYRDVIAE